jgi:hypothetical protein
MSFDRASAFYMGACQILSDEDQGMTPSERAAVYASLAQVEAIVGLAKLIAMTYTSVRPEGELPKELFGEAAKADAQFDNWSRRAVSRIAEDPREP